VAEATQAEAVALIDAQLQQGQRHFTLTEAAAMTGLSMDAVRHAMDALLTRYVCRLQVSAQGDLIYHFGDTLRRRGEKTAAERRQELLDWLWRIFTVIYKAWIAVTLVVYFILFLVIVIVVLVAVSTQQSGDDRRRRGAAMQLGGLFDLFFAIFRWRTITGAVDYRQDREGYRYQHYEPRPAVLNKRKKSFIASVYDFVFGPPRVEIDPLTHEREVAAYLLQHKGVVVASELSALAGWNFPQADTFLADCAVRYQGELQVSDNAVLYGQFDDIMRGVGEVETGAITYYWDEYEPEYEWTGNSGTHNVVIILMNGFNLLMAFAALSGGISAIAASGRPGTFLGFLATHETLVSVLLGWLPFVFSLLFFLIPLARGLQLGGLRRRRHEANIRKRLLKAIFARQGRAQTVDEVLAVVNANTVEESLARPVVETMLKELSLDMPGDMSVSDTAEVHIAFPRITSELQEVRRIREHRQVDDTIGDIIIESDN
jgi:hypothetical protein